MERWVRLTVLGTGMALTIVGILFLVLSAPELSERLVDHRVVRFVEQPVVMGPYHLETGEYAVWIEDYFPGFDNGEMFEVVVHREEGIPSAGWTSGNYMTRTLDGKDCEHAAGYDNLPEDDWTFEITVFANATGIDEIDVFITREYDTVPSTIFGAGVVFLSLGLIGAGFALWKGLDRE